MNNIRLLQKFMVCEISLNFIHNWYFNVSLDNSYVGCEWFIIQSKNEEKWDALLSFDVLKGKCAVQTAKRCAISVSSF